MQGVHEAVGLHRAGRGDERLPGHLAAEDPLALGGRADATEDVDLDLLEVEQGDEGVDGGLGHAQISHIAEGSVDDRHAAGCDRCRTAGRGRWP